MRTMQTQITWRKSSCAYIKIATCYAEFREEKVQERSFIMSDYEKSKAGDFVRDKGPDLVNKVGAAADVVVEQTTLAVEQLKDMTAETRESLARKFADAARKAAERADAAAEEARKQAEAAAKAAADAAAYSTETPTEAAEVVTVEQVDE